VHVSRLGLTPLKGTRHVDLDHVDLTLDGPVGDRVFCLVDRARGRVLRTVENPSLMRTEAGWHGGVLTARLPGGTVEDVPTGTGEKLEVDYWGRVAALEVVGGPWAAAYSAFLGHDVVLARSSRPGEIVYGGSVSLVTSSSLDRVARDVGPVDGAQFRATFTVDTAGEEPYVEDGWVGRTLLVGDASVEVRSVLPRCAVVDLDPATGTKSADVLKSLAGYRRALGEIVFGVDAVVTRPGRVEIGATVERG
jgi:uncharacterized protein YcbX